MVQKTPKHVAAIQDCIKYTKGASVGVINGQFDSPSNYHRHARELVQKAPTCFGPA